MRTTMKTAPDGPQPPRRCHRTLWLGVSLLVVALLALSGYHCRPIGGMWTNPLGAVTGIDPYVEFADGSVVCYAVTLDWTLGPSTTLPFGTYRKEGRDWVVDLPSDFTHHELHPGVFHTRGGWLAFRLNVPSLGPEEVCFRRVLNPFKIRAIKRKCRAAGPGGSPDHSI